MRKKILSLIIGLMRRNKVTSDKNVGGIFYLRHEKHVTIFIILEFDYKYLQGFIEINLR